METYTVFLCETSVGIEHKTFVTFAENQLMELTVIMKYLNDLSIERKLK